MSQALSFKVKVYIVGIIVIWVLCVFYLYSENKSDDANIQSQINRFLAVSLENETIISVKDSSFKRMNLTLISTEKHKNLLLFLKDYVNTANILIDDVIIKKSDSDQFITNRNGEVFSFSEDNLNKEILIRTSIQAFFIAIKLIILIILLLIIPGKYIRPGLKGNWRS